MDIYDKKDKFFVAVDCIIFGFDKGKIKLLVFNRKIDPFKGAVSLVGSFVRIGETVSEAAVRILKEFTGLENVYMKELSTYSSVDRDPGYRCISVAQYALIRIDNDIKTLIEERGAKWFDIENIPELVLDHNEMVMDALERIQKIARYEPIGFELLPKKFTIPQLQTLYEAIYRRKLDPRNFRKKILSLDVIIKLHEKDKTGSKKGAFLYKFDYKKYIDLQKSGYNFEI
ncbi:NUDIX domain-containing protein [Aquimarina gracilis]|uniref:NUDIX domain-containing protein n=1 Tax=Aquimarina gracilis TaxID=874422 RepID=A0ABU5ZP06_9FLAO|nr:NUDIX domain-containing protein [Aquimarina gracilis]MEB3343881.1 NUDIX domain-containing protein [Aquimarina gracilis]